MPSSCQITSFVSFLIFLSSIVKKFVVRRKTVVIKVDFFRKFLALRLFLIQGWEMVKKKACHVPFFFCQNCFLSSLLGTKRIKMENEVEKFEK